MRKASLFTLAAIAYTLPGVSHAATPEFTAPSCKLTDQTLYSPDSPLSSDALSKIGTALTKEEILKQGIPAFCKTTTQAEMYKLFGKLDPATVKLAETAKTPDEEIAALTKIAETTKPFSSQAEMDLAIKANPKLVSSYGWQGTLYPDSRVRKTALDEKLSPWGPIVKWKNAAEARAFFADPKSGIATIKDRLRDVQNLGKSSAESGSKDKPQQSEDISAASAKAWMICAKYTMKALKGCVSAVEKISTELAPRGSNMAVPVVAKVLSDPSYQKGASIFALKIMGRVEKKDSSGDLLGDLTQSYLQAGLSKEEAEDHAWNFIGAWATRGGNVDQIQDFAKPETIKTLLAMDIMSGAAPYLDQLRIENKQQPYSYPPSVNTQCSYGKTYHFWMSAFLSRKLGKELKSPEGAMVASYLSEIGYQMLSKTAGRDPARAFKIDSLDPINNKMRLDVAFGAAGAVFGRSSAEGTKAPILKIDTAITELVKNAGSQELLSDTEAAAQWEGTGLDGYTRWMDIFNPDVAFEFFQSAQK